MTPALIALIKVVHVLAGAFWFGVMVFNGGFLLPSLQATGPAAGAVMRQLAQVRRLPVYLTATVHLALLTGFLLLYPFSNGFDRAWFGSRQGILLSNGMLAAIVAAVLGTVVNSRTAKRLGELGAAAQAAGGPPAPELLGTMQALQAKLLLFTRLTAALLVIAIASMAAARYV